jgi:hypothetical protein
VERSPSELPSGNQNQSLFVNGLAEDTQKVPATDLSDLIRGEAGF